MRSYAPRVNEKRTAAGDWDVKRAVADFGWWNVPPSPASTKRYKRPPEIVVRDNKIIAYPVVTFYLFIVKQKCVFFFVFQKNDAEYAILHNPEHLFTASPPLAPVMLKMDGRI